MLLLLGQSKLGPEASTGDAWKSLNKTMKVPISKNGLGAAFPEIAMIIGGLDESSLLPPLLQLNFTEGCKQVIRQEIDDTIGDKGPTQLEACKAAMEGQANSRIGIKGDA